MLPFYLSLILDDASKSRFEELYTQHRNTMMWSAQQILNDLSLSEDAVHDAFMKILDYLDKIPLENCHITRSFVVIIVKNISYDYLRRKRRRYEENLGDYEDCILDTEPDPEELFLEKEGAEKIQNALRRVKQTYKEILALHVAFDLSAKEIAHLTNLSADHVRARLHRGRIQLKKYLKEV